MLNFVSMALLQVVKLLQLLISEVFILCGLLLLAESTASLADGPGLVRVSRHHPDRAGGPEDAQRRRRRREQRPEHDETTVMTGIHFNFK